MPDKKPTDVTDNNVGKITDSEIVKAKEVSLKEQIEHYNQRRKEVFDRYYRKNTEGNEDTLEICVLRESAVLISKLESIINRLQAENERLKSPFVKMYEQFEDKIKAEAYKEFAERLKKAKQYSIERHENIVPVAVIDWILKELVGEDK
jgi:hypothetical protein